SAAEMRVLVTGGAGFIGSFVVDRLLAAGHAGRVLDNLDPPVHPARPPAHLATRAGPVRGRVRRPAPPRRPGARPRAVGPPRAGADADAVVHAAAAVGVGQSLYRVEHYVDVNVRGTATLLDALQPHASRLRKLLVFTSMTGYGEGVYRRPSDGRFLRVAARTEEDIARHGWEPVCPDTGGVLGPAARPEASAPPA